MRQNQLSDKAVSHNQQAIQVPSVQLNQQPKSDAFQSNFHIPQKYQQQRAKITLKPPTRDNRQSLQISSQSSQANIIDRLNTGNSILYRLDKYRVFNKSANNSQNHIRKVNISENRTNSMSSSNSKSRLSANLSAFQMVGYPSYGDSEHKNTQSAVKLKKIIGNSADNYKNQGTQFQSESPVYRNRQNLLSNISNNFLSTSQESFSNLRKLEKSNIHQNVKTEKSVERVADLQQKLNQIQSQYSQKLNQQNQLQQDRNMTLKSQPSVTQASQKQIQGNIEQQIKECYDFIKTQQMTFERITQQQKNKLTNSQHIKELFDNFQGKQLMQEKLNLSQCLSKIIKKFLNQDSQTYFWSLLMCVVNTFTTVIDATEVSAHLALQDAQDQQNNFLKELDKSNHEIERLNKAQKNDQEISSQIQNQLEKELDVLQNTINDLQKQIVSKIGVVSEIKQVQISSMDVDNLDTNQLKDISNTMQTRLLEMSEKEQKLIKLVLAIKNTGVDIEKIYNEEVLNDDSELNETIQSQIIQLQKSDIKTQRFNDADNSIVNDSDESSFHYNGRNDQDSVMERNQVYQKVNQSILNHRRNSSNPIKLKLNLSHLNKKQRSKPLNIFQNVNIGLEQHSAHTTNKSDVHDSSNSNLSSVMMMPQIQGSQSLQPSKVSRLQIDFKNQEPLGFHQVFMQKLNEFSESWRQQAIKDDRRINLN